MPPEEFQSCEICGATIYPEHLSKHAADRWNGKLLCPHCLREMKTESGPLQIDVGPLVTPGPATQAATAPAAGASARSAAAAIGSGSRPVESFRRPLLRNTANATRCRTFHAKLTDAAFVHLNDQINEWVDGSDEIEIKFATSSVGVVEGKHPDPHLIVTVFY